MSSVCHIVRGAGLSALLLTDGEPVVFRQVEITAALVDRAPLGNIDTVEPILTPPNGSTVTLRVGDVEKAPEPGEYFVDSFEKLHRIESVRSDGMAYICRCRTSG